METNESYSKEIITTSFEMQDISPEIGEEEFLEALSERVAYMLDNQTDFLMSLLYRLDVLEYKINLALSPLAVEPPHVALARLILDRQKERIATRKQYDSQEDDIEEGLDW